MSEQMAHILLVEDDQNFGSLLRNYLELSGYRVEWVTDGNLGYSRFRQKKFDICLLDVMMPWRDGFSLAEDIRKSDSDIPLIFLTARGEKNDQIRGYKIGADDYLTKPFDSDLLLLKIQNLLKRVSNGGNTKTDEYKIGQFTFVPRKRALISGENEEKLSPKEADLLALFCQYINEVMPRRKALMEIWGSDDYFATRSMDVYVTKLRKRLKADPQIEIESLHGSGYLFRVRSES